SSVSKHCAKTFLVGTFLFAVSCSLALALPSFTWDPSRTNPPLSGAGSAFTADTILTTNYLHAVNQTNGSFQEEFVFHIDAFQLGDQVVTTPGLNSAPGATGSYGLYFAVSATGLPTSGAAMFGTLNISLMGDPGNNNGAITAATSGVSFANTGATGPADDITLGSGTLVSAMLSFNPATGV